MTKYFKASKLEELIHPYDLNDVMSSLVENGLVESYERDYEDDEIAITVPKDVEIREIMATFEMYVEDGRKKKREH